MTFGAAVFRTFGVGNHRRFHGEDVNYTPKDDGPRQIRVSKATAFNSQEQQGLENYVEQQTVALHVDKDARTGVVNPGFGDIFETIPNGHQFQFTQVLEDNGKFYILEFIKLAYIRKGVRATDL